MKNYILYLLFIISIFSACSGEFGRSDDKIFHKRVYEIPFPEQNPCVELAVIPNADTSYLEFVYKNYDLVSVQSLDSSIHVWLRYSDTANFLKTNFYDGLRKAYFPCEVALNVCKAQFYLQQINPDLSLIIFDAARPLHIQQMMWDSLKMPNDRKYNYLAPPYETSLHNYGCAVDVGIMNISQNLLMDMGSDFDTFEKISQPVYEQKFIASGELSQQALQNRKLLRWVMKKAGFNSIPSEWWHFSYGDKKSAAAKFKLIQ